MDEAHHAAAGLTEVATIALCVLVGGLLFSRLKQPPLVAYILAGVILGPLTGMIEAGQAIRTLAEFGVLMLLFVVGIKLDLARFREVWRIATITVVIQIAGAVAIAWVISAFVGWGWGLTLFFGFALALSSTAAVVQILPGLGEKARRCGQVTLAILIAQDFAVAPMIQIISAAAALEEGGGNVIAAFVRLAGAVLLMVVLVWWLSKGEPRNRLRRFFGALSQNEQLAPVAGLFLCFGAATAAGWLGLSAAYGAFLAGLLAGNSAGRDLTLRQMEPVQIVLVMTFFFSIGLLLDLSFIWDNFALVLAALSFVMVVKTLINFLVLRALKESPGDALLSAAMLSNIGEFSFLLATVGLALGLADAESGSLVVAVTVLSLAVTPIYLALARQTYSIALAEVPIHWLARRLPGRGGAQRGKVPSAAAASEGDEFADAEARSEAMTEAARMAEATSEERR